MKLRFLSAIFGRFFFLLFCQLFGLLMAHAQLTVFEKSNGLASSTYFETIEFFKQLDNKSNLLTIRTFGETDAGYPLHLVCVAADGNTEPQKWREQNKLIIMVLNGIHPGEPDGIDASQLLIRDIVAGKLKLPENIVLAIVPVYNIGGALNRGSYSRVNQEGPLAYGFRGNAQNLDLNRDFTKADSKTAWCFANAFHLVQPHILIDNHVSDGADFQHVFTLLTTQYNKLGEPLGSLLRNELEPALYAGMKQKGWDVFPYVNFNGYDLKRGMTQFYDPPRYSSGYAALFGCIGFVPETHMLKPFKERVLSTYDFMQTVIEKGSAMGAQIISAKKMQLDKTMQAKELPISWQPFRGKWDTLLFAGYERDTVMSKVTGLPMMQYNRNKPFKGAVNFYSYFIEQKKVAVPEYYVIPQGWHAVIDRLKEQSIAMKQLQHDTSIEVTTYHIVGYKRMERPYEKHFRHSNITTSAMLDSIRFLKGDWLIPVRQAGMRYLVEMLEPGGDDSFFTWNYFDAVLQQKEGYSAYRWNEVAEQWLEDNPLINARLDERKKQDTAFAANSNAILDWVYKNSPYYEPEHMRYPVFRIETTKTTTNE